MAWVSPLTGKVGQLITASYMNEQVRDNLIALHDPPRCIVFHNASQNVLDGTARNLNFDSEQTDPDGFHSIASSVVNPFITPTVAGIYLAGFEFQWGTHAFGHRQVRVVKTPGPRGENVLDLLGSTGATNVPFHATGSTIEIDPTLTETLAVEVHQNSSTTLAIPSPPFFAVHWISG